MDKKTFNKISKERFLKYGFIKQKDKYGLILDDITICVHLDSWNGVKCWAYTFSINALHDASVPFYKRFDEMRITKMEHNDAAKGYHRHEILYEEYTEEEYAELLDRILHKYFDVFKENALQYIKDNEYKFILFPTAKEYLGLL